MSNTDPRVLMLLGVISQLSVEDQATVHAAADAFRKMLGESDAHYTAFALVCAEVAAE